MAGFAPLGSTMLDALDGMLAVAPSGSDALSVPLAGEAPLSLSGGDVTTLVAVMRAQPAGGVAVAAAPFTALLARLDAGAAALLPLSATAASLLALTGAATDASASALKLAVLTDDGALLAVDAAVF